MNLLHWASRANDRFQDFRLGIKTCGLSGKKAPTPYLVLNHVFKLLNAKNLPGTFIDYGCGNGRVLAVAGKHTFQKMIGVEIDTELFRACKENLMHSSAALYHESAEGIPLPEGPCLHYFFHPFNWDIMEKVLLNIKQQAEQYGPQWLLLVNPAYYDKITALGFVLEECIQKETLPYEIRLLRI